MPTELEINFHHAMENFCRLASEEAGYNTR